MKQGYICDVCGKFETDKKTIEEHEKIPVTGLDLKRGDLFGYCKELKGSGGWLSVAMLLGDPSIDENHKKGYSARSYVVNTATLKIRDHVPDIVLNLNKHNLDEVLVELTQDQYDLIIRAFEIPTDHGMKDEQLGKSVYSYKEALLLFHHGLEFSRGKLNKIK